MRCDQFERLMHAWIDGDLAPEDAMEARAHADACPLCAELAGALRDGLAACRDIGDEAEVPQAAAMAWRRAVRAEAAKAKKRRGLFALPRWQSVAGLAAGILVLIGGANLVRIGRTSLQPIPRNESADFAEPISAEIALAPLAAAPSEEDDFAESAAGIAFDAYEAPFADTDADLLRSDASGGALDLAEAEPESEEGESEEVAKDETEVDTEEEHAEADAPAARSKPLAFLLDACIFLALCLPPAAIAFCVFRLRKREKKAPNQPER